MRMTAGLEAVSSHALPPVAPVMVRDLCRLAFVAWLCVLGVIGYYHVLGRVPDFEFFYEAGWWLAHKGAPDPGLTLDGDAYEARGKLDWYLPFVPRLMSGLSLLPYTVAGTVWLLINLAALTGLVRLIGRQLLGLPPKDWPVTLLVPFSALALFWYWEFRLNQADVLTLAMLVGGFVLWERGRRGIGGFWLGLATLMKITPGLIIVWFLLKRQYRTVAVAGLTVLLAGPVSDVIVFGPRDTVAVYRDWFDNTVRRSGHFGLVTTQREMDWRNQGLGAVLSRWLHTTDYTTRFDNDPRAHTEYEPRYMNVAHWPLPSIAMLAQAASIVTLIALLLFARKPASKLTVWQLRLEWALFVLAMLWFMPVMRRYHMVWAFPAVAMLAACVHYAGPRSGWTRVALASIAILVAAQIGALKVLRWVEASGGLLLAVVCLAIPILIMLRRIARNSNALPPDPFLRRAAPAGGGQAGHAAEG